MNGESQVKLLIRRGKIFVGHAGDSGIVLGEQDENNKDVWNYRALTKLVNKTSLFFQKTSIEVIM